MKRRERRRGGGRDGGGRGKRGEVVEKTETREGKKKKRERRSKRGGRGWKREEGGKRFERLSHSYSSVVFTMGVVPALYVAERIIALSAKKVRMEVLYVNYLFQTIQFGTNLWKA